jgi:hypothetical protein
MGCIPDARPPKDPLLPIERRSDVAAPVPFPQGFSFPFLSLPPEVRRRIYRLLFRSTIPIYPTIESLPEKDKAHNLKTYERTSFPVYFLLTSRQIHKEASAVLWGDNQIVFQFPLNWNNQSSEQRLRNFIRPPWFVRCETFIPSVSHRRQIRNLVIEVYLFRSHYLKAVANRPAQPATKVRKQLTEFVNSVGAEHQIYTCEIRFCDVMTSDNPNEILVPFPAMKHYSEGGWRSRSQHDIGCCFHELSTHFRRQWLNTAFGRRGLNIEQLEELCKQSVDVDQQVLEPLTKLRGVQNVKVVGRVTDDWAEFVKVCIQGKPGTSIDDGVYEHRTTVRWFESPGRKKKGGRR